MILQLRPPLDHEWPACRMLLPETFGAAASREYLLALREEAPHIVAAASFLRQPGRLTHLRLHVVPTFRRRGVATQILAHLAQPLEGVVDLIQEPAAVSFCERAGFHRVDVLTTVEADIAPMRDYMANLRRRLGPSPHAVSVPLSETPLDQVAALHARYVAHDDQLNPWRALVADSPALARSPVVLLHGRVAGILLWELVDATAVVRSRVAAPLPQSRSINAVLLAEGLDAAWAAGARRVRFSYNSANRDTRKLALRFQAQPVAASALFARKYPVP